MLSTARHPSATPSLKSSPAASGLFTPFLGKSPHLFSYRKQPAGLPTNTFFTSNLNISSLFPSRLVSSLAD